MTNQDAIEVLKAYKQRLENSCSNQLDKDIAIKALNTMPFVHDMSNTIYRLRKELGR